MSKITLCSYTYNDGSLLDKLLADSNQWTLQPDEIIIVDDGSDPPYKPKFSDYRLKLLRLPQNSGPAIAKSVGITAASGDFVLSVDCDMRIDREWLKQSLSTVQRKEIGLIGASVLCDSGKDIVSTYMNLFGHQLLGDGEADFLSGNIWLMRKEVWDKVGGFSGYTKRTHEDHYFCNALKSAGFKLVSCSSRPAYQVRKLSRHAVILRFWYWFPKNQLDLLRSDPSLEKIQTLAYICLLQSFERINYILRQKHDTCLLYLELAFFQHCVLNIFAVALSACDLYEQTCLAESLKSEIDFFWLAFKKLFSGYPRLFYALFNDAMFLVQKTNEIKIFPKMSDDQNSAFWSEFLSVFTPLTVPNGPFSFLEREGVDRIINEDTSLPRDYSFYLDLERS